MRVRPAVVDDADAIERVRTDTWRDAYRGLMPDSLLDGLGYDATRRRAQMSALPAHQFVLVAEVGGASAPSTAACAQRTRQAAGEGEAEPYERMGGAHVGDEERELEGVCITESGYGWEDIAGLAASARPPRG